MPKPINVVKRNGAIEPLDLNKIHRVVEFACEGINNVSESEVELRAELQFFEGITSDEIQQTLIKSASDLITEDSPNYQYVASRLVNYDLRKRVYNDYNPWPLYQIVKRNVELGYYDPDLLVWYSEDEWNQMDTFVKHSRDFDIAYAGIEQFRHKYLIKNKITNQIFETPQVAYMVLSAAGHWMETKNRLKYIKDFYNHISTFDVSLPTPVMAGVRSTKHQFSSCTLIDTGDDLDSINAAASSIVKYAANRAGIGINIGRIRAVGSPIRNGETTSTGVIPFLKYLLYALKSCNQGGIRSASGNACYPIWHYEFEDLIVLKNNKGTEEMRARGLDYTVQMNKFLINRALQEGVLTLFSPSDVPGLYDAFFQDQALFEELYVKYENDPSIRKKQISALDALSRVLIERKETGRIYIQFVDNTNELSTFDPIDATIYMTNLCVEVTEPTVPLSNVDSDDGEIALCTLAAYNLGNIKEPRDFERVAKSTVRFLDNLLSIQDYPVPAALKSTNLYRNLGIGVINFAYFLAKHNQKYTDIQSAEFIHPFVEAMSFYTIKASAELAEERGRCDGYKNTKWAHGILPIDKYRKFMDTIVPNDLLMDWEKLRDYIAIHGMRNATLMALMPAETSAQISNSTNGIEPPRSLVSIKSSKDGSPPQVVPEMQRLKNKYELLWDQESPRGYLALMGVFNKFICQSISTNTSYNPKFFENGIIPMSVLLGDLIYGYQLGLRTFYYNNEYDQAGELDAGDEGHYEPSDVEEPEEDCDACKI